jgi:C-terminal processing protease CtpA/Prc
MMRAQEATTTNRLAELARLWGYVKYHHPSLAYRAGVDWDAALVTAIPRVRQARSREEFRSAIEGMLATLEDPLTRLAPDSARSASESGSERRLAYRLTDDSILVITAGDYYSLSDPESQATLQRVIAAVPTARSIVLDVRSDRPVDDYGRFQLVGTVAQIERLLTTRTLTKPGERRRAFYGFENPSLFASGQYRTGFFTRFGAPIVPGGSARDIPNVVLLNQYAVVPDAALPLQVAGRSLIVLEGDSASAATGRTRAVGMGEQIVAQVRESEQVFADGTSARLQRDLIIGRRSQRPSIDQPTDMALDTAVALARRFRTSSVARQPLPATADGLVERSYQQMTYPSPEYRLLALFRFWNVIRYFYPYHRLLSTTWDSLLPEFIPKFEQARDSLEYSRAVAEMAKRLQDSHAYVAGAVYNTVLIGAGYPPIRVRMIEGQPVVVSLADSTAHVAGARVGDVVVRVDGEDAKARLGRYAALISASTPQSLMDKAALSFMNGPVGSPVRLLLQGAGTQRREVTLTRRLENYSTLYHRERTGEIIRLLPGNIGYVDLDRLTFPMVDSMFERLRQTKAIIFDMRGYPNSTIYAIAPRLSSSQARVALLETPLVGHATPGEESVGAFLAFYQTIDPTPPGAWLYAGRTVMLMDERSQSQAEHTGLFLRAANGTRFVGSATAGADGEIATVVLPGAITIGFTGQSVRYPDGGELQRTGLVPDVPVAPTIRGLRQGRDEVLERALRFLTLEPWGRAAGFRRRQ